MAKKGSITIQGSIVVPNAYLCFGGVSGSKDSTNWSADVQVFSDGGVARKAYQAALQSDANADPTAMNVARVNAGLPIVTTSWQAGVCPYENLYNQLQQAYPDLQDDQ
jgi:hypothetical protein